MALLRKLLAHMQAAERGLQQLESAADLAGFEAWAGILESSKLDSMGKIDNLEMLKEVDFRLEEIAAEVKRCVRKVSFSRSGVQA